MSALREWEERHERELEEVGRKEEAERKERRAAAADELSKWYEEHSQTNTKRLSANRIEEQSSESTRSESMKPGANPWERVSDLIDVSAKSLEGCRDTSRMRSLLIQLKTTPVIPAS